MNMIFELSQCRYQPVQVDARDKVGNTALHYASLFNNKGEIKLLLKKGADTNSTNNNGSTPLHIICMSPYDILNPCESVKTFFEINNELQQTVLVDARDKVDRTPLQWAVANLMPFVVELLLDGCSADLSNFVFPTEDYFGVRLKKISSKPKYYMKSKLWSCALLVVRILERKGYELDRSDALTIVKFFDKYELFEESDDIEKCYNDEEFTNIAKKKMIAQSLSLYDLLRLRPEVFKKGVHIVYRAKPNQEHLYAPMQTRRRALNCPKRAPSNGQRVVVLQEGSNRPGSLLSALVDI
ncbi:unnamed protein product [Trichogramma brassicae]|uniref:Uncharacterized protein n=1 Tax=Trichogramma brassicae TaxID=86971 RepID=A0A6H5ILN8_9HYME|nr:unnamed protein product [Trichogramma brassicae]